MSVLTTKQIMEIIPHRQPFLLIDTVEELVQREHKPLAGSNQTQVIRLHLMKE